MGLEELLRANDIEFSVDVDSYAAGFQGVSAYILDLIKTMEGNNSSPEEIILDIKNVLDNGSYPIIN